MFEFGFKRKLLLRIFSVIMTVALFCNIGFSNCFAINEQLDNYRAMIFSEYVIDKLDNSELNLTESLKVDSSNFSTYSKEVCVYNGEKKQLIKDNIIESEVYKDIKKTVDKLVAGIDENDTLKKAAAIYEWVAKNIKYDHYSEKFSKSEKMATQNAFCAFKYKKAICIGFSQLLQMMMRLAGIPCKNVVSILQKNKKTNKVGNHAFNVIYLNDRQRSGWTLLDSTWASCALHDENKKNDDSKILNKFFPALDNNKSFKKSNTSIMSMRSHKIQHIGDDYSIKQSEKFGDDEILMCSYIGNLRLMYIPGQLKRSNGYSIEISDGLSRFDVPIFFKYEENRFYTAPEIIVEGNVEIDFNKCDKDMLDDIKDKLNFDESNRYKFDEKDKNIIVDRKSGEEVFNFRTIKWLNKKI